LFNELTANKCAAKEVVGHRPFFVIAKTPVESRKSKSYSISAQEPKESIRDAGRQDVKLRENNLTKLINGSIQCLTSPSKKPRHVVAKSSDVTDSKLFELLSSASSSSCQSDSDSATGNSPVGGAPNWALAAHKGPAADSSTSAAPSGSKEARYANIESEDSKPPSSSPSSPAPTQGRPVVVQGATVFRATSKTNPLLEVTRKKS